MNKHHISSFAIGSAQFFRSLDIVIIFLVSFIAFQTFETQTLFYSTLSKVENPYLRLTASILAAIVFDVTQLIFTVNKDKFFPQISVVIAGFSLIINLLFFEVWVGTWDDIVKKLVASTLFTSLSFLYTELFVKKWSGVKRLLVISNQEKSLQQQKVELLELKEDLTKDSERIQDLNDQLDDREQVLAEQEAQILESTEKLSIRGQNLDKMKQALQQSEKALQQNRHQITQLETRKKEIEEYIKKCTCEKCGKILPTPKAKSGHMRHCKACS